MFRQGGGFVVLFGLAVWVTAAWAAEAPVPAPVAGGWVAKRFFDPFRNESRCVVETAHQVIHDGYQDTVVFLRLDAKSLMVVTESNLDLARGETGLRVDEHALIKPDRLYLDQSAVFESEIGKILAQFKTGKNIELILRFWPTWPDKGRKTVSFSLTGFSRAFARLPAC